MLKKEDAIEVAKGLAKEKNRNMVVRQGPGGDYKVYPQQFGVEVCIVTPDGRVIGL